MSEEVVSRAKFRLSSVTSYSQNGEGQKKYEFSAVYDDGTPENKRFAKYSPSGTLSILVDNPNVVFEIGESYYLDFVKVPKE